MELVVIPTEELRKMIREEASSLLLLSKTPKPENDICGIDGAAELTGWAKQTLYMKHSRNEFPENVCFKSGKKLFFSRSAMLAWITRK